MNSEITIEQESTVNDNITSFIKEVNASFCNPNPIAAISATTY
jgi:hypothetical protein